MPAPKENSDPFVMRPGMLVSQRIGFTTVRLVERSKYDFPYVERWKSVYHLDSQGRRSGWPINKNIPLGQHFLLLEEMTLNGDEGWIVLLEDQTFWVLSRYIYRIAAE